MTIRDLKGANLLTEDEAVTVGTYPDSQIRNMFLEIARKRNPGEVSIKIIHFVNHLQTKISLLRIFKQSTGLLWEMTIPSLLDERRDSPYRLLCKPEDVTSAAKAYVTNETDFLTAILHMQWEQSEPVIQGLCEQVGWTVKERHLLNRYIPYQPFVGQDKPTGV